MKHLTMHFLTTKFLNMKLLKVKFLNINFTGAAVRIALTPVATAVAICATPIAQAQGSDYPNKPITMVTAFPVGSGPDIVLRMVSEKLSKAWNQRVVVENKPGGGGFIAIDTATRAPADGYTLLQLDSEHLSALPHLYKQRGFDTLKTFEPVTTFFRTPFLIVVPTESKWQSVTDMLAAAKAQPGKLPYGSWGVGSPGHLGAELLEDKTGVQMQHVPYREMSQLFLSVGSGDVTWSFGSIPSSQPAFKSGKVRYLAVAAPKRIPQMPDVPTVAEAGGPASLDVHSFVVLVALKGVPEAARNKISTDIAKALTETDVKTRLDTFAFEPISWSPEEINRNAEVKFKIYEQLVKRANISLD